MSRTLILAAAAAAVSVAADRLVRRRYGAGLLARCGRATTVLTVRRDA
ncbi:hypothetical protein [Pseudonocardia xishanensis]|uniref:Uncharacterized protein n=1 Tax=Pseudonocardia xishanensis TaxID=630995 RepID=A0ABP8RM06_9PSEU